MAATIFLSSTAVAPNENHSLPLSHGLTQKFYWYRENCDFFSWKRVKLWLLSNTISFVSWETAFARNKWLRVIDARKAKFAHNYPASSKRKPLISEKNWSLQSGDQFSSIHATDAVAGQGALLRNKNERFGHWNIYFFCILFWYTRSLKEDCSPNERFRSQRFKHFLTFSVVYNGWVDLRSVRFVCLKGLIRPWREWKRAQWSPSPSSPSWWIL